MRLPASIFLRLGFLLVPLASAEPLPIDPLWQSESFRKALTGSYGIDSRIEPLITTDEEFYLDAAGDAMAEGDRTAAITALEDSSILERSPAMLFLLGNLQYEEEEWEKSAKSFEAALEAFPNFRDAHRNLALVMVREERYDEAKEHLVRAVALGSREGLTMGLLGYCHAMNEHHQAALDAYRLAALTEPEQEQWQFGQAQALSQLGEHPKAVAIYGRILDGSPSSWNGWILQADDLLASERFLDAIANLEVTRRAGKLSSSGLLSLGNQYLRDELVDLAVARYEEAFRHEEPVAIDRALSALELLSSMGRFEEAKQLVSVLEETRPDLAESLAAEQPEPTGAAMTLAGRWERCNALLEIETGEAETGAQRVRTWLKREPTDGLALILLARYEEEFGEREVAEMLLEQAAGLPEHAAEAHRALGRLLVAAGDYEGAIEQIELALSRKSDPSLASYLEAIRGLLR